MSSSGVVSLQNPKPFLKWVGGKTQLISEIDQLINKIIDEENFCYIEPFVGGGAVLFHILNQFNNIENIVINDINHNLVNAYREIQKNPLELIDLLLDIETNYYTLKNREEKANFYLAKREIFNRFNDYSLEKIALLLFLNKTCFNGLYRVNKKGKFNVPFGQYKKPNICDKNNLISVHHYLQKVKVLQGDFEETLKYAIKPSIFYLDPPYKPINLTSSFTSYSEQIFDDNEQIRLKKFCDEIHRQGNYFILSNSDVKNYDHSNNFFDELYKQYNIKRVKVRRNINSKGNKRGEIFELLITNF
ncbi:MAG: DNA adenine methylase [Cyanobacteria bacterium]|nr:DNA adenine methylase [Cyanobacteria bacterium CG_2015-16_32_12]NCO79473.1 DNA adenine methylase [Cyanobacteria bacterium CG_2015-22_32_23]NCQ05568.1 DNA adenine methylase [Cyanobacteria bacterium CG_2015-09_32_10]NCQ42929.1 DNA adenine methylase [Cyanobacteria bacterium CG_2015-04_32_10]NCS83987.1 DNA adenine methylase [Cyanobacteria bacterium CG_2015-02_32_10]